MGFPIRWSSEQFIAFTGDGVTDQLTLGVDEPRARRRDPQTSRDAAASITPGRTEALILALFPLVTTVPRAGFTDDQFAAMLPGHYSPTVKTARSRLSKAGLLVDSGVRRPSNRGRLQIVWRLPG